LDYDFGVVGEKASRDELYAHSRHFRVQGTRSRNANAIGGVLSLPETALPLIVPMLISKRLQHVLLRSNGPFRASLDVGSFRCIQTLTADYFREGEW
jgi:hypothetical protein